MPLMLLVHAFSASMLLLLPLQADASWRLICPIFADAYMDPIVAPGVKGGHLHHIAGNLGFSDRINPELLKGNATTCSNKGDFSNYWAPAMYRTDTADGKPELLEATFLAYYLFEASDLAYLASETIAGQPLAMVMGRSTGALPTDNYQIHFYARAGKARKFVTSTRYGWHEEMEDAREVSIRYEYPSCWNGGEYLSDQSHVAYPDVKTNRCPDSHPRQFPHLRLEQRYNLKEGASWTNATAPFLFSTGGETTAHSDVVMFWDSATVDGMYSSCGRGGVKCPANEAYKPRMQHETAGDFTVPAKYAGASIADDAAAASSSPTYAPTASP